MSETKVNITTAGIRILKLLIGKPPQTMAELIKSSGVTRTAVSEQLHELLDDGFIERNLERLTGRGRPRHRYQITHKASLFLASFQYARVEMTIWQAIEEVGGAPLTRKVVNRLSRLIAKQYNESINGDDPVKRLKSMAKRLRLEGVLVDIEKSNGSLLLHKRNCQMARLFNDSLLICKIDEQVMKQTIDKSVRRIACRHLGDPCCTYELPLEK